MGQVHIACTGVKHDAASVFPGHRDGARQAPTLYTPKHSRTTSFLPAAVDDVVGDVEAGLSDATAAHRTGSNTAGRGGGGGAAGGSHVLINVRGPLKGPIAGCWSVLPSYDRLSMFASGVGITPVLSVFLSLCDKAMKEARYRQQFGIASNDRLRTVHLAWQTGNALHADHVQVCFACFVSYLVS